ncbi:hypothetical protein QC761_0049600 [Podospora bellae-mahoneyi]|uniref:Uncharacterized protein n=1 Tax=Podospora bellae-mahoneyi TaxID=2093777 RepID=A0ABR0FMK6_9PEZI|nr:hypothetical protein QC761_0049600 [Podospora bellae-mahoneyi]
MNLFSDDRRLRLHELTHSDMVACVRDKLDRISGSNGFDQLVEDIVEKGQGIFQCVGIVVKNMRYEIDNTTTEAQEFKDSLKMLPSEINDLYKHIFDSLRDAKRAYRTLATVSEAMETGVTSFSVEAYSFFQDYEWDRSFVNHHGTSLVKHASVGGAVDYSIPEQSPWEESDGSTLRIHIRWKLCNLPTARSETSLNTPVVSRRCWSFLKALMSWTQFRKCTSQIYECFARIARASIPHIYYFVNGTGMAQTKIPTFSWKHGINSALMTTLLSPAPGTMMSFFQRAALPMG